MNNTTMAKIAGWSQFGVQVLGSLATTGLPTNPVGWLTLFTSLMTAVGVHGAASTDGAK